MYFTPGTDPLEALRRALRAVSGFFSGGDDARVSHAQWSALIRKCIPEDAPERIDPGGLEDLLVGLTQSGIHAVLCIDQLEEAFTQGIDPDQRDAFLNLIVRAATRTETTGVPVLLAMRADLMGGLVKHEAQGDFEAALKAYEADLAIAQRVASLAPTNAGWRYEVGVSEVKLALIHLRNGRHPLPLVHRG